MMDKPRNVAIYMRVARAPRAWIYCRTAGPDAYALRMQQEELSAFAEKNHYDIVGCTSKNEAGTTMARPGLAEITNAALRGEMDILLILNGWGATSGTPSNMLTGWQSMALRSSA